MNGVVGTTLGLLALPVGAMALYLLVLTLRSGVPERPQFWSQRVKFDVVIPAHDEAEVIAAAVASVRALDWPPARFRVVVVADNCSDDTAARARAAGALVLERHDLVNRGKGHALAHAFAASRALGWADAVVVVDADSRVSANLLEAFAARLDQGAHAVQAHYRVLNAQDSWRTRLMAIAMAAFHGLRSRAREGLGLSCGLRGNGWCVTHQLLQAVPYAAWSLAEDVEYGIDLGLAGERVHYADEAQVAAAMLSGEADSRSQRRRWEDGRRQLQRTRTGPLLSAVLHGRGRVCADLLLDLLMPPLSSAAFATGAFVLLAGAAVAWDTAFAPWLALALACAGALVLYVLRGWQLSGVGRRGLIDLARAPAFMAWKLVLMLRPHDRAAWIRTRREKP